MGGGDGRWQGINQMSLDPKSSFEIWYIKPHDMFPVLALLSSMAEGDGITRELQLLSESLY